MCSVYVVRGCVFGLLKQIYFLFMSPWRYTFYSLDLLYGISHGFDITHDLLVMTWNFKDILRFVFTFVYVMHIAYKMSAIYIMWTGLNSYYPMDNLNIMLLSLMVGSHAFNLIIIGGFHLHGWSWCVSY